MIGFVGLMPYGIEHVDGDRWRVLDRASRPLGVVALTADDLAYLRDGGPEDRRVYLYDDAHVPTSSPAMWGRYTVRLRVLCRSKTA